MTMQNWRMTIRIPRGALPCAVLLLASGIFGHLSAQTQPSIIVGPNVPSPSLCSSLFTGNIYIRSENPSNGPINVQRCTQTGNFTFAWMPIDHFVGTTLPTKCQVGDVAFDSDATAGQNLYGCTSTDTWVLQAGGGTGAATSLTTATLATLPLTCIDSSIRFVTDATVSGGGTFIYLCHPADTWFQFGYVAGGSGALTSDCSSGTCTIEVTSDVARKALTNVFTGSNNFSGASFTAPFHKVTSDPATCDNTSREIVYNSTSNLLKVCNTLNTWTSIGGSTVDAYGYLSPFDVYTATTAALYQGGAAGAIVATRFTAKLSGSFTRVHEYNASAPGAAKGVILGIYDATGASLLAWARSINPNGHFYPTFNSTLTLVAGTTYVLAVASEVEYEPSIISLVTGVGGLLAENSSANMHWVCTETTTGTNTSYALPATCVVQTTSSVLPAPAVIFLP